MTRFLPLCTFCIFSSHKNSGKTSWENVLLTPEKLLEAGIDREVGTVGWRKGSQLFRYNMASVGCRLLCPASQVSPSTQEGGCQWTGNKT